jgi:site-specific DNA-methyltransferase (adenine-specific)
MDYHYDIYNDKLMEEDYIKLLSIIKPPAVVIHYPEETINILPKVLGKCSEVVSWAYNNPLPVAKDFRLISWWGIKPDLTKIKVPYATATINDKRAIGKMNTDGKGLRDWWIEETIRFPSHENTEHPCQIPEAIMKKIIAVTAGNRIFDPFAGSGTTLVAAKSLGRKAIGVEISERYCRIAIDRLRQRELF